MCKANRKIVESLWEELMEKPFSIKRLSKGIIDDCGHDSGNLTRDDLVNLYHGSFDGDWHQVAFAFNEVLAFYLVEDLSNEEFIRVIFVSLFLAEATRCDAGDLWYSFEKIMALACRNKGRVDSDFIMSFLAELLRGVDPEEIFA